MLYYVVGGEKRHIKHRVGKNTTLRTQWGKMPLYAQSWEKRHIMPTAEKTPHYAHSGVKCNIMHTVG